MITADQAADTLRLLIPGFLALKVFYRFGLRNRPTDLEWTLWSLLVAALIDGAVAWFWPGSTSAARFPVDVGAAIGGAGVGSACWSALADQWPRLRAEAARTVWDEFLRSSHWIQVWTTEGTVISGYVIRGAYSDETDDPDLYIAQPAWVGQDGVVEMAGTEGVIVARSHVALVQVLKSTT